MVQNHVTSYTENRCISAYVDMRKKGISVRIRNCRTTVLVSCLLASLLQRKRTAMNLSQSTSSFQHPHKPVHDRWILSMAVRSEYTPFLENCFPKKGFFYWIGQSLCGKTKGCFLYKLTLLTYCLPFYSISGRAI